MFFGEYEHSIDLKGRLNLPSKFRDKLSETFYVTKGFDHCLFIYDEVEWRNFEEKLKTLPVTDKNARNFVRLFFAGAQDCVADKQGRFVIPQNLREYAGLEKDIVIIGVSNRIEVWSKTAWNTYSDNDDVSFDDLAAHMANLGI